MRFTKRMQGSQNITVLHIAVDQYTLKSAHHTVKKGCDSLEDPKPPENRNPLREVVVKLLPSTPYSMTLLDNRSPLTSSHLESRPLFLPPVHVASSRPRRQDFFPHSVFNAGLASERQRI